MANMVPEPRAPLTPPRPGFAIGLRCFFGGFGFVLGNARVWPLAAVPLVITLTLASLLGYFGATAVVAWIASAIGPTSGALGGVLAWIAKAAGAVVAVVLALLASMTVAQPLSGPALERIVRQVESAAGAPGWPPTSWIVDVGRSLESLMVGYAFGLPILATLVVVDFLFPPIIVVTLPLKILVTALLVAWDLCDYPLSIRGRPVGQRVQFMRRNAWAVAGFGAGLALLATFLPCAMIVLLPFGAAGAARLVHELEEAERRG